MKYKTVISRALILGVVLTQPVLESFAEERTIIHSTCNAYLPFAGADFVEGYQLLTDKGYVLLPMSRAAYTDMAKKGKLRDGDLVITTGIAPVPDKVCEDNGEPVPCMFDFSSSKCIAAIAITKVISTASDSMQPLYVHKEMSSSHFSDMMSICRSAYEDLVDDVPRCVVR